jgi:hypothetical protein
MASALQSILQGPPTDPDPKVRVDLIGVALDTLRPAQLGKTCELLIVARAVQMESWLEICVPCPFEAWVCWCVGNSSV